MAVTAILVEDDRLLASALAKALASHGIEVLRDFPNAEGVLSFVEQRRPDVALIDLDLGPGPTGLDIAKALRSAMPRIGLVILTSYVDPRLKGIDLPALPRGTKYLSKNDANEVTKVADALLKAANTPLIRSKPWTASHRIRLTDAQIEVLLMVAEGLTNPAIAERRGVSVNAVEQMLSKMYLALNIPEATGRNQRVQLVGAYLRGIGRLD